jgi:hypothetical protein
MLTREPLRRLPTYPNTTMTKDYRIIPRPFVAHVVGKPAPTAPDWITRLTDPKPLSASERNRIASFLSGLQNGEEGSVYLFMGWRWSLWRNPHLQRILVHDRHCGWRVVYSTNKTAWRQTQYRRRDIIELHYLPKP